MKVKRRPFVALGAALILAYGGTCGALYVGQRSLLYFPTPETRHTEAAAQAVYLENAGEQLKIWHVPGSSGRAVLYFGGNAEDVAWNIQAFASAFAGDSIYLVNYRGYGGSTGEPSEQALFDDAEAVFDHVESQHSSVAIIGRSLGSGVAMHLAAARDPAKLVLVTPYDSILNVAQDMLPFVPVSALLKDHYDSASLASRVRAPTLVLLAERDRVIPRASSERLVSALDDRLVETRVIPASNHDSISSSPEYLQVLGGFL